MSVIVLDSPYAGTEGIWFKGNLHTHTTISDGSRAPEEVISDYERRGYDFLALAEHDVLVSLSAFQPATSMVLLPAAEVTGSGPHILQVGGESAVPPFDDRQDVVDGTIAEGGMAIGNHPNWGFDFGHCPQELLDRLAGLTGIEVYNGVIERLEGSSLASDRWDRLLSGGRRLWGFGSDDSHLPGDVGKAWIVVRAAERSGDAILQAIRRGSFYASTGVAINDVRVEGTAIHVSTEDAQRIRFITRWGVIRSTVDGAKASWSLDGCGEETGESGAQAETYMYVRVECYGTGGRMAWTQPIWVLVAPDTGNWACQPEQAGGLAEESN